ncbi:MAG: galactokinase [Spirochaetes bacterium]|nr:galactokinase [Spirochaetota bacterium]
MEKIISLHRDEYISEPEVVVEAPGALTIMGNHVDSDDGLMIQAALDMKIYASVSRRKDSSLRFYAADFEERKKTSVGSIKYKREDRWANYIKGVLFSLENAGFPIKGLDITITGNIPQSIGLASSSAMETAITLALSKLYDFNISREEVIKIIYAGEEKFLNSNKVPSGVYSSLFGKEDNFLFTDLRSAAVEYIPALFEDTSLVITMSNVPAIQIEKEIAERRKDIQKCIERLNTRGEPSLAKTRSAGGSVKPGTSLRDYNKNDIVTIVEMLPEQTRRRCIHVIDEISRTEEAKSAIKKNDMAALGKLMSRSHESLRDNFEVSCPEIDWLVKRAQEIDGVYGSKITGTGFGGCTITLLKNSSISRYLERLDEYERIFGFKADMINCTMASGAKVLFSAE